jgi:glutamate---cysteine ligase / carboxylate-amine ligase
VEFRASDPNTIGMELEFQLLDAGTLDLVDGILALMDLYPHSPYVKPEVIQNTVEVASRVCCSIPELEGHLRGLVWVAGELSKARDDLVWRGHSPVRTVPGPDHA